MIVRKPSAGRGGLDGLRSALLERDGDDAPVLTGLRSHGPSDLAAILHNSSDSNDLLVRAVQTLERRPEVASVLRSGRRVLIRLDGDFVARLGEPLERGAANTLAPEDGGLTGQRFMIQYLDPNATKALHVGHLRNIALGHAMRCGLRAAGADAFSRSAIGDAGRQIGEAMAGCLSYGDPSAIGAPGVRGDHVVGEWYSRYVAEHGSVEDEDVVDAADRHLAREVAVQDDLATSLLERWKAGDADAVALWRAIRDWAVAGQNETLARLGVRFDVEIFESTSFPRIQAFVDEAVGRGVLRHAPNGAVIYETGDANYPVFPLGRPDGFPTQNLRTLMLWHELMPQIPDVSTINIVGEEWRGHTIYVREILQRMGRDHPIQPTYDIVHGMVSTGDAELSSSSGDVLLVDALLDELASSRTLRELEICDRPGCGVEELAVLAALACSLNRPLPKSMVLTAAAVLDSSSSTGLLLARAWSKAWAPSSDGEPDPDPRDAAYRFAVVYCHFQSDVLSQALVERDVLGAVRSLVRMAKWYMGRPTSPSVDRVMRAAFSRGLSALGMIEAPAAAVAAPAATGFAAHQAIKQVA